MKNTLSKFFVVKLKVEYSTPIRPDHLRVDFVDRLMPRAGEGGIFPVSSFVQDVEVIL